MCRGHCWNHYVVTLSLLSSHFNSLGNSLGNRRWLKSALTSVIVALQWRHNEHDCVSNHRHLDCSLDRLFRRRSKKTSKFCATGLCEGNSPVTGEFLSQRTSNAENVSIWWRHHGISSLGHTESYDFWVVGLPVLPLSPRTVPGTSLVLRQRKTAAKTTYVVVGLYCIHEHFSSLGSPALTYVDAR